MIPAIVTHIEYSQSNEVTFVYCKPETLFIFKEGQFLMISSDHVHPELGKQLKKPYSIATTNQELQEHGTIGFIVKKVRDGFMSDYLTTHVKVGETLHLQGLAGHMFDTGDKSNYLLISVGSGLSPLLSIYEAVVAKQQFSKVVNIFGERFAKHVLPSTASVFSQNTENIKNMLFLSKEENETITNDEGEITNYRKGHVQDGLEEALSFLGTLDIKVFICGHPAMVDDVKQNLLDRGIDAKNINFEKY